jgi:hypothetical protein
MEVASLTLFVTKLSFPGKRDAFWGGTYGVRELFGPVLEMRFRTHHLTGWNAPNGSALTAKPISPGQELSKWYNSGMSLQITIPPQLEQVIAKRAAEVGVDVQTYVLDTLSESLSESLLAPVLPSEFIVQLDRISEFHKSAPATFDDSRESIYMGCGE